MRYFSGISDKSYTNDTSDTHDTSNTANSCDANKTCAFVTRLSIYFGRPHEISIPMKDGILELAFIRFLANVKQETGNMNYLDNKWMLQKKAQQHHLHYPAKCQRDKKSSLQCSS